MSMRSTHVDRNCISLIPSTYGCECFSSPCVTAAAHGKPGVSWRVSWGPPPQGRPCLPPPPSLTSKVRRPRAPILGQGPEMMPTSASLAKRWAKPSRSTFHPASADSKGHSAGSHSARGLSTVWARKGSPRSASAMRPHGTAQRLGISPPQAQWWEESVVHS